MASRTQFYKTYTFLQSIKLYLYKNIVYASSAIVRLVFFIKQ